jgi:catechol 2,3-dioxygenase-like lactoylglutathione lyase family enzyme
LPLTAKMKFHFDCIFYYVTELDRSIHFHRDLLGLKLLSRDAVARFDIDGVLFELVPASGSQKFLSEGNARLCLRVENAEQALRQLKGKGIVTKELQNKGTGVLGSFEDPDGNEICLWQFKKA